MNQYYYPRYYQRSYRAFEQNEPLLTPQEGFLKGNMFANSYIPYKNYQPQNLTAQNEQENLFLQLAQTEFAAHDLNIYLDLFPQDGNALDTFNQYRQKSNQLQLEYEQKYGPLLISSNTLSQSPFLWESMKFPWNEGGM